MSYPTLKAAFAECVKRLKAQEYPAVDPDGHCVYRTKHGLRCAVGIMLSEDTLDRIESADLMNANISEASTVDGVMDELSIDDLTEYKTYRFWDDMQEVHDAIEDANSASDNWWDEVTPEFIAVAKKWDIDIKNTAVAS